MRHTYLALLRGVNVGGKNRLPMKALADLFVALGCSDVRTFIQSGNVVFSATPRVYAGLPEVLPEAIRRQFAIQAPVILRTRDEIQAVVSGNPFVLAGEAEGTLYVAFLRDVPCLEHVAGLDPDRSPPDRFEVLGREVYLHLPAGVANSKLTNAYFDSKLKTLSTARNWRTVQALLDLMT
ncbi:MAG: DUF1697 domain-containing protein [Fimbriimonadaceae bacterium]